ncbi:C39 family peptidase [Marmoricola sp. RAF53]|uniref:C39 family peptidase n=1 Tax=Marmoricola sp. RAF53 TaxID=3233059 RepID=UPI003F954193
MRRSGILATLVLALLLPAIPATADHGGFSGGGISGPGDQVPATVRAQDAEKQKVADAYLRAKYGPGSAAALSKAARNYAGRYPKAAEGRLGGRAGRTPGSAERAVAGSALAITKLDVAHYAQLKSYYCGPATGKMILAYKNEGPSALTGAVQNQYNIGDASHMRTDINGKTGWDSGLFRIGLNKWRVGTSNGYYVDKDSPTPAEFKSNLVYDIDNSFPVAANTVETAGKAHYNGHPKAQTIGHWIVARGYYSYGDGTNFLDPSTSVWDSAQPAFTSSTGDFAATYLQINGITW